MTTVGYNRNANDFFNFTAFCVWIGNLWGMQSAKDAKLDIIRENCTVICMLYKGRYSIGRHVG